ncbi:hypothetical protein M2375_001570 [Comamonas sp. BIGb0152]|uniref:hypothetical protein n=1 Tax=Comamonas sp. BIGb0152 TaxID=2940601 RepID=UPI0021674445|nr:hypothetical protein [Comamonas sp. BIGb0152]MCS4293353.1 hypothetical protein [Comamonas sp. BIGb0152]
MSFTDKIIFNIQARTPVPKTDVDSRNVSDDDDLFHQPFRTMAEPINRSPKTIYIEKIVRLLQQAAANKATI